MELLLYDRYIIMIFSPLSSQFRINFCKNLQKIYCINSVLYSKCLPCTKNAISRLTSGPQKSFTTLFSPDRHRKKAQYSFYHKNLEKGNKITNNEGYRFFGTPCMKQLITGILGNTKGLCIRESNTLTDSVTIRHVQRITLLIIKGQCRKESNVLHSM